MSTYFEIEIAFNVSGGTPELFEDFLDTVLAELGKIGHDADVSASLANFRASFMIETPDRTDDSLIAALSAMRTALHAADCGTPGWPTGVHVVVSARSVHDEDLAGV